MSKDIRIRGITLKGSVAVVLYRDRPRPKTLREISDELATRRSYPLDGYWGVVKDELEAVAADLVTTEPEKFKVEDGRYRYDLVTPEVDG